MCARDALTRLFSLPFYVLPADHYYVRVRVKGDENSVCQHLCACLYMFMRSQLFVYMCIHASPVNEIKKTLLFVDAQTARQV